MPIASAAFAFLPEPTPGSAEYPELSRFSPAGRRNWGHIGHEYPDLEPEVEEGRYR